MSVQAVSGNTSATSPVPKSSNRVLEIGNDVFLKLLLAELKNQDPLSPMDNHQLVEQIAQLRAVEANMQLTKTLEAVMRGQALQSATSLLGQRVEGLAESGQTVRGTVDRVTVEDSKVKLAVGEETILLENIRSIEGTSSGFWGSGLL
jgi:flagellar basal-body rod modification protein FlgD